MRPHSSKLLVVVVAALLLLLPCLAAKPSTRWYSNARFGMFIHWGLYSKIGNVWNGKRYYGISEWIMNRAKIPVAQYAKVAATFDPTKFDADTWVKIAKQAGFRYIIITAKHHDGFAMYHSKVSKYNIYDATPWHHDPLKELAAACRKYGIKLGFYYSQVQDWHDPNAVGNTWDFDPAKADFARYVRNKVKPQLNELLTRYGNLGMIWFDTPKNITLEQSRALVNFVHSRQPNCLTTSRVGNGLGDYICLGDDQLPPRKKHFERPIEALFRENESWGYSKTAYDDRSPKEIIRLLVTCAARGANLLFDIGPKADGTFPKETVRDLRIVGDWMKKNGDSIYGSHRSPFPEAAWGFITTKPDRLYLHVLDYPPDRQLRLWGFDGQLVAAKLLASGKALVAKTDGSSLLVRLPVNAPDNFDTVVEIDYTGQLHPPAVGTLAEGMPAIFPSATAKLAGAAKSELTRWAQEFGDWQYANVVAGWTRPDDKASWTFRTATSDRYYVELDYAFTSPAGSSEGLITVAGRRLYFEPFHTGDKDYNFFVHRIGVVSIKAGEHTLTIAPTGKSTQFIRLRCVRLLPYR